MLNTLDVDIFYHHFWSLSMVLQAIAKASLPIDFVKFRKIILLIRLNVFAPYKTSLIITMK